MKTTENLVMKERTKRPSLQEGMLAEKFDPLSGSVVEQYAGVIVRSAVDIARYARTIAEHDHTKEHYERLIRATEHFARIRFVRFAEHSPEQAAQVRDAIEEIEWPTVQPVISFPLSYDGSEPAAELSFLPFTPITAHSTMRTSLPA